MQLVTERELAVMLNLRRGTVRKMVKDGNCPPPINVGGQRRWRQADIDAWLDSLSPVLPPLNVTTPGTVPESILDEHKQLMREYDFRPKPCVYFLFKGDTVIYVGQTDNLPVRIDHHRRGTTGTAQKDFDRVLFLPARDHIASVILERRYISLLRPEWNGKGNKPEAD